MQLDERERFSALPDSIFARDAHVYVALRYLDRRMRFGPKRAVVVDPFRGRMRYPALGRINRHVTLLDPEETVGRHRLRRIDRVGRPVPRGPPAHLVANIHLGILRRNDQAHVLPAVQRRTASNIELPLAHNFRVGRHRGSQRHRRQNHYESSSEWGNFHNISENIHYISADMSTIILNYFSFTLYVKLIL